MKTVLNSQNFPADKTYPFAGQVFPIKIVETFSYVNYDRVSDNAISPEAETKLDAVLELFKSSMTNAFTLTQFNEAYKQLNADLKLLMEEQEDGTFRIVE